MINPVESATSVAHNDADAYTDWHIPQSKGRMATLRMPAPMVVEDIKLVIKWLTMVKSSYMEENEISE